MADDEECLPMHSLGGKLIGPGLLKMISSFFFARDGKEGVCRINASTNRRSRSQEGTECDFLQWLELFTELGEHGLLVKVVEENEYVNECAGVRIKGAMAATKKENKWRNQEKQNDNSNKHGQVLAWSEQGRHDPGTRTTKIELKKKSSRKKYQ